MCARDDDTVLWFSVYVGGTPALVSDVTAVCLIFVFFA